MIGVCIKYFHENYGGMLALEKFSYNASVREEMRKKLGVEDKFVIGHAGRFNIQKNHEYLIEVLYLLNLAATVFSYWLFAYKNSLLMAHQRTDVTSKVSIAVGTVQYCAQFLAIYIFKNYYFYLIMAILSQIANNIVTSNIVSRMYPDYLPKGRTGG